MNRTDVDEQGQRAQDEERREQPRARYVSERVRRRGPGETGGAEVDRLREVGRNLGSQLEEQVHKRPFVVIGAAAGVGFVAGSLFGSRLGQMILAVGLGYLVKNVVNGDIGVDRIQEGLERLAQQEREHG